MKQSALSRPVPTRLPRGLGCELAATARQAAGWAYAPYSKFQVGAALLAADGRVFTGCNVENASYGLTLCAERTALVKAVSEGARRFRALAVAGGKGSPAIPCGACLQMLSEFCPPGLPIFLISLDRNVIKRMSLQSLLPVRFAAP